MSSDSYYSHSFLVSVVSLFFIYQQKGYLARPEQQSSVSGLIVLLFTLLLHILGTLLYIFSISGLRSLMAFLSLGSILAYLQPVSMRKIL